MEGNVLTNRSNVNRPKTDFYPTPPEVTVALLNYLKLPTGARIWEPACGKGHMGEVMKRMGYKITASDLNDFGYGEVGIDFIGGQLKPCDWIITNPPFKLSVDFIDQCIKHRKPFALLLKSQYWHAKKRKKLFDKYRPSAVLPLTWRPDFLFEVPLEEGEDHHPTMECLWTVWGTEPAAITEYHLLEKPSVA